MSAPTPDVTGGLRSWQRFHLRITAVYSIIVLAVLSIAGAGAYGFVWNGVLDQLQSRMALTVRGLADNIDSELLAGIEPTDPPEALIAGLTGSFETLAGNDPSMSNIYVLLYDPDPAKLRFLFDWDKLEPDSVAEHGEPYDASALPQLFAGFERIVVEDELFVDGWGASISAYAPVRGPDGAPLALVGVDVAAEQFLALKHQVIGLTLGVWLFAVVLIGIASVLVGRNVRDPLTRVIEATARIAQGSYETRLGMVRTDEFGLMARHFDLMAEGLQERERIRETFGRYVAPDVARALLADSAGPKLGGEVRVVTVLFVDLRGYSTVSELLSPSQTVTLLNGWLGAMQVVLDSHGGTVIEFMGDAILAVFNAPSNLPDHARRAVCCAAQMQAAMAVFNAAAAQDGGGLWERAGFSGLGMRVGIHTGPVVAGNIGSATRMKYAVIGDAVNVAARLEQLNKTLGTTVLVSEDTVSLLGQPPLPLRSAGAHALKGRANAVSVFTFEEDQRGDSAKPPDSPQERSASSSQNQVVR